MKLIASILVLLSAQSMAATLPAAIRASLPSLYQTALTPFTCRMGAVEMESSSVTLQQAVSKDQPTVVFVVRRPG